MGRLGCFLACAALLLGACGSPDERDGCDTSAECPRGEFCARTGEGNVCWPDAVAPAIASVEVTCLAPTAAGACPRDGTVRVIAQVSDDEELAAVSAEVRLRPLTAPPPGTPDTFAAVSLTPSALGWTADVPVSLLEFRMFDGTVTATVVASDGARNEATPAESAPLAVTRLRWTYEAGRPLSPAAITADGKVVVARAASDNQALALNADGTLAWQTTLGAQDITAAPMIGAGAIWFASTNGTLYQVAEDGVKRAAECATGGALSAPAALAGATLNFAVVGNEAGSLYTAGGATVCDQTGAGSAVRAPVAVGGTGKLYAPAGTGLRAYNVLSGGGLDPAWTVTPTIGLVTAASALDVAENLWTVSTAGAVNRTDAFGEATPLGTVGTSVEAVVILPDGSAVLGDDSGRLKRLASGVPAPAWTETVALNGTPAAPLVLAGETPALVTGTSLGWLQALRASDAALLWSRQLGTSALRLGNVFRQPADALPTAYFPAADGRLHAVVVDGPLDPASPWPKPYHDARNTGNAATPIP